MNKTQQIKQFNKEYNKRNTFCLKDIPYPIYFGGWRFFEQTRRILHWPLENCKNIVDVGCGHQPFPYANILIDKSISNNRERFGISIPRDGRVIIEADIEKKLPFCDKEIDFLYCSHTLEHCHKPEKAIEEIIRVSKSGFVETPNIVFEMMFGGDYESHKWITEYSRKDKILIFRKLTDEEIEAIEKRKKLGNLPRILFSDPFYKNRIHRKAYWQNQELFTNCFLWEDSFEYNIVDS